MRVYYSWAASENPYLSFGKAGRYIAAELSQLCEVVADPGAADLQLYFGIPLWVHRRLWRRKVTPFCWYTMWEHPAVPRAQIERINATEGLASPCQWCDAIYEKRGATVPRFVVPLGIDPVAYAPICRPQRDTFTFLWLGMSSGHIRQLHDGRQVIGDRKRGWLVRQAFEELELGKDARLVLKTLPWPTAFRCSYRTRSGATISEIGSWMSEQELRQLYAEADVFVWPTWGEGFGLPPLEAAATGMPVILPNYSGMADFFDPSWCLELPHTLGRIWSTRNYVGARVRMDDLKAQMVWAYEHRNRMREMGREAARCVHAAWTWERATRPALATLLAHYN